MNDDLIVRWVFGDVASRDEKARRFAVEKKIDAWWRAFQAQTQLIDDLFHRRAQWDLPEWMEQNLQSIDHQLMWEYGPALKIEGNRLVITPESARHLRPLTDAILARAPHIAGWEFYPFRQPEDLVMAQESVKARAGADLNAVTVRAVIGEHNRIDLMYYFPNQTEEESDDARHAAFVATESLLGEERLDKWIGAIETAPLKTARGNSGVLPLDRLRARVDAVVGQIQDQAPPRPTCESIDSATWSVFKLEPEAAEDYLFQHDLFVATSMNQPLWLATHAAVSFHSERFSKCGETYCYLKIDGSQGLDEQKFADRSEIEDALDEALALGGLGCHIGGGTGLRYSYIELALSDVPKSISTIQAVLREGNVPVRSWILFHDDYLTSEWVGVYEDSPTPPLPTPEGA